MKKITLLIVLLSIILLPLEAQLIDNNKLLFDPATVFNNQKIISINGFILEKIHPIYDEKTEFWIGKEKVNPPDIQFYAGKNMNGEFAFFSYTKKNFLGIIENNEQIFTINNDKILSNQEMIIPENIQKNIEMNKILEPTLHFDKPYFINKEKNKLHSSKEVLELELAVETTTEFYDRTKKNHFDQQEYLISLYQMVSYIYEEYMNITIKLTWVKQWTDINQDPYKHSSDPNVFGGFEKEVREYWQQNYKNVKRDLVHVLTAGGGGGLGEYDAIGQTEGWNYSVISPLCSFNYPLFSFNYDVHTIAHELGHNFGAHHTHSCFYGGHALDSCEINDENEDCISRNQEPVPKKNGTIMSYCWELSKPNGLSFHPTVAKFIREKAEGYTCLTPPAKKDVYLIKPQGETSYIENKIPISWLTTPLNKPVNVFLSIDNGETWDLIEKNSVLNDDTLIYKVPHGICGKKCRIKIQLVDDPDIYDITMLPFTIKSTEDSLWAYYPFDDGSTDDMTECGLYPLTNLGAKEIEDRFGIAKSAFDFYTSKYMKVPNLIPQFNKLSVSVWIKPLSLFGTQTIMTTPDDKPCFKIRFFGDIVINYNNGETHKIRGGYLKLQEWSHIVFIYDGITAKFYINGKLINSEKNNTIKPITKYNNCPLFIGSNNKKDYFNGSIDDIRIYNIALTEDNILKLYNEVKVIPKQVKLISPLNGIKTEIAPLLQWQKIDYTDSYHIQISTVNDFSTNIIDTILENSFFQDTLKYSTKYYWRVLGTNILGNGEWSDIWTFTIDDYVSVNEKDNYNINIYPNPFMKNFIIEGKYRDIIIYNIFGNIITEKHYQTLRYRKNIINELFIQGIYFIKIDNIVYKIICRD